MSQIKLESENLEENKALWEIIKDKRIVLLVGSGGVGKTTVSASIALFAAMKGKKVLAVTIDPAKRLANSLGLKEVGNVEKRVELEKLNIQCSGELWVMMLDVKRSLDDIVITYAPSSIISDRILKNNIYKAVSDSLAGTEEIVALGKIYELQRHGNYDLIVVDTAPTKHAIDFFETPTRLVNLLDMRIIQWFLKPIDFVHKIGFKTFRRGTSFLIDRVEKSIGLTFFTEIAEFLQNFEGMFEVLQDRAGRINEVLKNPEQTVIGLVSSPESDSINNSLMLSKRILQLQMPMNFIVINRIHPLYQVSKNVISKLQKNADSNELKPELLNLLKQHFITDLRDKTVMFEEYLLELIQIALPSVQRDKEQIKFLQQNLYKKLYLYLIPYFESDVCDLNGLLQIDNYLFPMEDE